jgi:hypothetical protein
VETWGLAEQNDNKVFMKMFVSWRKIMRTTNSVTCTLLR